MEFHVDILPLASPFSKHLSPIYLLIQTLPTVWFSSNSHFPFQLPTCRRHTHTHTHTSHDTAQQGIRGNHAHPTRGRQSPVYNQSAKPCLHISHFSCSLFLTIPHLSTFLQCPTHVNNYVKRARKSNLNLLQTSYSQVFCFVSFFFFFFFFVGSTPAVMCSTHKYLGGKGEVSSTGPTTHEERGLIIVEPGG